MTAKWINREAAINWINAQVFERCSTLNEAFDALLYLQGMQYMNQFKDRINVPVFFEGSLSSRQVRQLFNDACKVMEYDAVQCWNEYNSITVSEPVVETTQGDNNVVTIEPASQVVENSDNSRNSNAQSIQVHEVTTTHNGYTQFIYNSYHATELSHNEWQRDVSRHNSAYNSIKDIERITDDSAITDLIHNGLSFWFKVVNENPYFHSDCVLIELTLRYINKPSTHYITKKLYNSMTKIKLVENSYNSMTTIDLKEIDNSHITAETCNNSSIETNLHWYEMLLRPFAPFCQPKGYIQHDESKGRHGIIAYNRPLTVDEIEEYELSKWAITG